MTFSNISSSNSPTGLKSSMRPALLMSTSTLPNSLTASSIMPTMCALLVMSPTKGTTSPP